MAIANILTMLGNNGYGLTALGVQPIGQSSHTKFCCEMQEDSELGVEEVAQSRR